MWVSNLIYVRLVSCDWRKGDRRTHRFIISEKLHLSRCVGCFCRFFATGSTQIKWCYRMSRNYMWNVENNAGYCWSDKNTFDMNKIHRNEINQLTEFLIGASPTSNRQLVWKSNHSVIISVAKLVPKQFR